jgi:hypothetical protein
VDLNIHSPKRLHGVMLNLLSTGTTLPLPSNFLIIKKILIQCQQIYIYIYVYIFCCRIIIVLILLIEVFFIS